ncbi:MAG: ATP-binding protein [Actinomycetota bacterium]|nr:ATP-binding protein [Actinomycetota bacterium]
MDEIRLPGIDEAALRRLIALGEPGGVERKQQVPRGGLGSSAAAFANTRGGWIVLGVDDAGEIVGWQPPGSAQIHDHVRELLRRVDPMPTFDAELIETVDGSVGVVHVPESAIKPHVMKDEGVVYEREPGGKRPIDSQSKLVALATSPKQAQIDAEERLGALSIVRAVRNGTIIGRATNGQTRVADWVVAATPLSLSPELAVRVRDGGLVRPIEARMRTALAVLTGQSSQCSSETLPKPAGLVLRGADGATNNQFEFAVDAGGVAVARWSTRVYRGAEHIFALADNVLAPLLAFTGNVLAECGAVGQSYVEVWVRIGATDQDWRNVLALTAADQSGDLCTANGPVVLRTRLELPLDDVGIRARADEWALELGRYAGMPTWQRSVPTS